MIVPSDQQRAVAEDPPPRQSLPCVYLQYLESLRCHCSSTITTQADRQVHSSGCMVARLAVLVFVFLGSHVAMAFRQSVRQTQTAASRTGQLRVVRWRGSADLVSPTGTTASQTWLAHLLPKVARPNARPCHQLIIIIAGRPGTRSHGQTAAIGKHNVMSDGNLYRTVSPPPTLRPSLTVFEWVRVASSSTVQSQFNHRGINRTRSLFIPPCCVMVVMTVMNATQQDCIRGCAARFKKILV